MAIFFRLQEASWELWRWMGSDWGDRVWSLMGGKQRRQGNEEVGVSDHLVVVVDSERERKSTTSTASDVHSAFRRPGFCGPNSYSRKNYTILMSRLMIMALLAIIVGGMAFLTWYLTQMYFVNSVNTISLQLRQEMLESSKGHFRTLIHNSVTAAQAISIHVNNRDQDDARPAVDYVMNAAAPLSYSLLKLFPNLTVTGYLTASGPFIVYGRTTAESNTQAWYKNDTSINFYWTNSKLDVEGKPLGKAEVYVPMFNAAALFREDQGKYQYESNGPFWKMFSTAPTGPQMVSFIRTRSRQGVAVAGISLRTMSDFMANAMKQPLFRGGYMYFMNQDGMLLSVSDGSDVNVTTHGLQPFADNNFIKAENAPTAGIAAGAKFLQLKVGIDALLMDEQHFSDIKLMGETYYVDSTPLSFMDLTVVGVILLPRHAVMHKVDQRSRMTMVIILVVAASFLVLGFAAIFLFTNRVSTEMELKAELILQLEAKRKAEASSNHKSQFMANMSHELRTPMAGIIGLVDILLSDDSLTSEQMDNVSQIRRCSMALLGLLNNILDLSKVEAGKLGLEKCDFDLGHEVASLVDMFSVQCLSSGVEIALDLSDDFPKMVRGDSARLRQIFANLVSNAIKFTPSGWICVKGWVETPPIVGKKGLAGSKDSLSDTVMLHFEVEDTGCGIDPHKWESVFESFVQADASTTRTHGGTGLGLSIVRSLVHMMGGDIGIVPKRSGRGTLIKFFVVLDKVHLESAAHPQGPQHEFPDEAILEPVLGAQVVWGMAESLGRQIGARWMLARGFEVHEVGTWPEILPTIRDLLNDARRPQSQELSVELGRGSSSGGKYQIQSGSKVSSRDSGFLYAAGGEGEGLVLVILDIALLGRGNNLGLEGLEGPLAELQELRDRGIHVAWLLSPSTSKAVRRRLRDKGYTVVANKPVYQSKLLQLLLWLVGANDRFEEASPEAAPKAMVSQGGGIQVAMEDLYTSDLHGTNSEARTISLHSDQLSDSDTDPDSPLGRHHHHHHQQQQHLIRSPPDSSEDSHQSDPTVASSQSTTPSTPYSSFTSSSQAGGSASGPRLKSSVSVLNEPVASSIRKPLLGKKLNIPTAKRFAGGGFATPSDTPLPLAINTSTTTSRSPWPRTCDAGGAAGASPSSSRLDPVGALLHLGRATAATKCSAAACEHEEDDCPQEPEDVVGPGQYPLQFEDSQFLRADSHTLSDKSTTTSTTARLTTAAAAATSTSATAPTSAAAAAATGTPLTAAKKAGLPPPAVIVPSTAKSQQGHGGRHRRLNSRPPNDALAGIHILVAEDTPVLRRLAVLMLQKLGATVTAVGDGLEAFMAVTATHGAKIDLVLMDCQMPKMDGYQSTQEIRSAERLTGMHTPIVALTAHAMASDEERCLAVGMDAYLTKPIDSQLLVSTLLNLLQRLQQQQQQQSANPNAPISPPPIASATD